MPPWTQTRRTLNAPVKSWRTEWNTLFGSITAKPDRRHGWSPPAITCFRHTPDSPAALPQPLAQIAGRIEFAAGRVQGVGQHDHIGLEALDPLIGHGAFFVQLQVVFALRDSGLRALLFGVKLLGQRRALRVLSNYLFCVASTSVAVELGAFIASCISRQTLKLRAHLSQHAQ
jgi:hypothetical protein